MHWPCCWRCYGSQHLYRNLSILRSLYLVFTLSVLSVLKSYKHRGNILPPAALIHRRWCIGLVIIQGWCCWLNEFSQSQEHVYNLGWPISPLGGLPYQSGFANTCQLSLNLNFDKTLLHWMCSVTFATDIELGIQIFWTANRGAVSQWTIVKKEKDCG